MSKILVKNLFLFVSSGSKITMGILAPFSLVKKKKKNNDLEILPKIKLPDFNEIFRTYSQMNEMFF